MSMIGNFGLCPKHSYENLMALIKDDSSDAANDLITEIRGRLIHSSAAPGNSRCSGETFIALFQYLKEEHEIDVRNNELGKLLSEYWRNATGDYDMISFTEKEKNQLLLLTDKIDPNAVTQFINDFYQQDYGKAGQIASDVLFENLKSLDADHVLIWHLF